MAAADYDQNVFINCPFDRPYKRIFDAVIFTVFDCGFVARSALEITNTAEVRVDKIARIIDECRFGLHDLSRTSLDRRSGLPRFNMPFELGLFLGIARHAEGKSCLVLDRERYRYQKFISDISGQDIAAHDDSPKTAVRVVRNWLRSSQTEGSVPGALRAVQEDPSGDLPGSEARARRDDLQRLRHDRVGVGSRECRVLTSAQPCNPLAATPTGT